MAFRIFPYGVVMPLLAIVAACSEGTSDPHLGGGEDFAVSQAALDVSFEPARQTIRGKEIPLGLNASQLRLPAHESFDPELVELGNLLFFDQRLSRGAVMSCATCHLPSRGYAAGAFNKGVDGNTLERTTSYAMNRAFGDLQNWAGGQPSLEAQSTAPITNPKEMGSTSAELLTTVSGVSGYAARFNRLVERQVLTAPAISVTNIERALASFQRSLLSGASAVDRFEAGLDTALTALEKGGRSLVRTEGCTSCHAGSNYSDEGYHIMVTPIRDRGRELITGLSNDRGKFKTPSLRDSARRTPLMHDGSIASVSRAGPAIAAFIAKLADGTKMEELRVDLSVPGTTTSPSSREDLHLSPDIFISTDYAALNPSLAGMTPAQLREHWLSTGMSQGLAGSHRFAVKEYLEQNPEVYDTFGPTNYLAAIDHYLDTGRYQHLPGRHAFAPGFFDIDEFRAMTPRLFFHLTPEQAQKTRVLQEGYRAKAEPTGHFIVNGQYLYADGRNYCRFADMAAMASSYGRADLIGVPRLNFIPPNLRDGGVCGARPQPHPSVPGKTATLTAYCKAPTGGGPAGEQDNDDLKCKSSVTCPTGTVVRAVRAVCMLTANSGPTLADVQARPWNTMMGGGCSVDAMTNSFGTIGLMPQPVRTSTVGCTGRFCQVRAEVLCEERYSSTGL